MSIRRFAFAAALLLGQASASTPVASSPLASSQAQVATETCRTELGPSSVKLVPTTTITRTIHERTPVVVLTTTLETVTVTPAGSTEIVTDYETTVITSTADVITDTFSTTSTDFDTATLTLTPAPVTTTVAEVLSTTSTSTSTIATSVGFTPIVDTLPPTVTAKRSLEEVDDCSPWVDDYKYPQAVVCYEKNIIKTTTLSTVTGSLVTVTVATPTTTVTITNTITSSSVILPSDVSTTLSFSTTSTITETTLAAGETSTVTSTHTVLAGTTTTSFYAACATNNIAGNPLSSDFGSAAGKFIYSLEFTHVPGQKLTVGNTNSAYDCCASCLESSTCAMSYYYAPSSAVRYCYVIATTTCSFASTYGTAYLQSGVTGVQISNGNCGHVIGSNRYI
ncbi:TonB box, conserved site [Penicillium digitatum]|nr:TonB box, conserved site [Penicillium digitatum]